MSDTRNRRILLIDDNGSIHEDFRKILGGSGRVDSSLEETEAALFGAETSTKEVTEYEIDSAFQGQEGVEDVRKAKEANCPYAMSFVDMRMPPGWDGLETILNLRKADPDLQVVICTAYSDYSWEEIVEQLGENDRLLVLKKPFDAVEVRQLACALTRKWETERKAELKLSEVQRTAEEEIRVKAGELQERTTDLAVTNRALERKNQEMEQFVYTVSHDLKSPLVTMKGFVGVLKEDLGTEENDLVMDSVRRIENAACHMSRLIEDLLKLSRAGRRRGKTEPVDVSLLVHELIANSQAYLEGLGTTLEIHDEMPEIVADRAALSRVFENLLNNAIKYGCQGPQSKMTVGSETLDDEVRFFVKDNGPGIAPEYHKKIFGLFQRLDSDQDGTGVGLAIVEKIMQVHNGRVWVESSPGKGATFWLSFDTAREAVSDHS